MIANYHTHTPFSNHSVGTPREYIEEAIEAGFQTLGFSGKSGVFLLKKVAWMMTPISTPNVIVSNLFFIYSLNFTTISTGLSSSFKPSAIFLRLPRNSPASSASMRSKASNTM